MDGAIEQVETAFLTSLHEFIAALAGTWPDCPKIREASIALDAAFDTCFTEGAKAARRKEIVRTFADAASPHYALVAAHDPAFFDQAEEGVVRDINLGAKYAAGDIDEDTRECIWAYLEGLCRHATSWSLISALPPSVASAVEAAAGSMTSGAGFDPMAFAQSIQDVPADQAEAFQSAVSPEALTFLLPGAGASDAAAGGANPMAALVAAMSAATVPPQ